MSSIFGQDPIPRTALGRAASVGVALALAGAAAACPSEGERGDGERESAAFPEDAPEAAIEVWEAWETEGLGIEDARPVDFGEREEIDVELGDACYAARAEGVPTVVCVYPSSEEAEEARARGFELVGEATGASLKRGERVLVVVDREGEDPDGRTLQEITSAFRELGAES